jgi:hypothetical protein
VTDLAYVGHATGYATGSSTTISSAARSVASGAHLLACVRWDGAATSITVTDTAGNTYTPLTQLVAGGVGCQWFHSLDATGGASLVVTATFAAARSYRSLYLVEGSGDAATVEEVPPTSGSGGLVSTFPDGHQYGAGSLLLASAATYGGDSNPSYTCSGESFAKLAQTSNFHSVAYAASSGGGSAKAVTVAGGLTARVLATLVVDSGGTPPAAVINARVAQVKLLTLRQDAGVRARVAQVKLLVLRPVSDPAPTGPQQRARVFVAT